MIQKILIICPSQRDIRELNLIDKNNTYNFIHHTYATSTLYKLIALNELESDTIKHPQEEIFNLLASSAENPPIGVFSTNDYPGSALAPIIAHHLNLPGSRPAAALLCQHKLYAREQQQQIVPEATPQFEGFAPGALPKNLRLPFFVKPVKGVCSIGTKTVTSDYTAETFIDLCPPTKFFELFDYLLQTYTDKTMGQNYLLAEELLYGVQVTIDGFVDRGEVCLLGIVDSIMIPGTISFDRFEYPSSLEETIQMRMHQIVTTLIESLQLQHGLFNVELMYNPEKDSIHIIEINPRMSAQFADLYEKVDGTNTYQIALDLATGKRPCRTKRTGLHKKAAACLMRSTSDKQVIRLPDAQEYSYLREKFSDIRIETFAIANTRLSNQIQDGITFRYAGINLGGKDTQEILEKFEYCKQHLTFQFGPA